VDAPAALVVEHRSPLVEGVRDRGADALGVGDLHHELVLREGGAADGRQGQRGGAGRHERATAEPSRTCGMNTHLFYPPKDEDWCRPRSPKLVWHHTGII